jgi:hypothetical protein
MDGRRSGREAHRLRILLDSVCRGGGGDGGELRAGRSRRCRRRGGGGCRGTDLSAAVPGRGRLSLPGAAGRVDLRSALPMATRHLGGRRGHARAIGPGGPEPAQQDQDGQDRDADSSGAPHDSILNVSAPVSPFPRVVGACPGGRDPLWGVWSETEKPTPWGAAGRGDRSGCGRPGPGGGRHPRPGTAVMAGPDGGAYTGKWGVGTPHVWPYVQVSSSTAEAAASSPGPSSSAQKRAPAGGTSAPIETEERVRRGSGRRAMRGWYSRTSRSANPRKHSALAI